MNKNTVFKSKTSAGSKTIGIIKNGYLVKVVDSRKHLFKIYDGYGVAERPLKELEKAGHLGVKLIDECGNTYTASVATIRSKGIPYSNPNFEPQIVLPRQHWQITDPNQPRLMELA